MNKALLFLASLPLLATTAITSVEPGFQQIIIRVTTDTGAANCTYRASEGTILGTMVNDVNTSLFASSNSDARVGSIVNGTSHIFVLGTRGTAYKASDNKMYSRSLAQGQQHTIGVTCGGDAEVTRQVATRAVQSGHTWAENAPYSADGINGYGYPQVDFADKTKTYIDPVTGFKVKRITGLETPRDLGADPTLPTNPVGGAFAFSPGGNWTNPTEGAIVDGVSAISTSTNPLFIAITPITADRISDLANYNQDSGSRASITNLQLKFKMFGTGGTNNVGLCLTLNGVTCATDTQLITSPTVTLQDVTYPTTMTGYFANWVGTTTTVAPGTFDIGTFSGSVSVANGTGVVTRVAGNYFNVEKWTVGSHINLAAASGCTGGDYTILSIQSATQVTLASSPGTGCSTTYTAYNFGVLVAPQGAAVLTVDGVTFTWDEHAQWKGGPGGLISWCNPNHVLASADALGVGGHVCFPGNIAGAKSVFFVPDNIFTEGVGSRLIASYIVASGNEGPNTSWIGPSSNILVTDTNSSPGDPNSPNVWYSLGVDEVTPSKPVMLKLTYNPASACGDPVGYQNWTQSDASDQNCAVSIHNLTPRSTGTITDLLAIFDPQFDPGYYIAQGVADGAAGPYISTMGVCPGYVTVIIGKQNTLRWEAYISTTDGHILGARNSYTSYPQRWGMLHGPSDGGDCTTRIWVTDILENTATLGSGAFQAEVASINGNPSGTLTTTAADPTCAGADPSMAGFLPNGNGCDTVVVRGSDACNLIPQPYETSHSPRCSYDPTGTTPGSARGLWIGSSATGAGMSIALGDTAGDPNPASCGQIPPNTCVNYPGEVFLVVGKSGNTLTLLRNFFITYGTNLAYPKRSIIRAHAAHFFLYLTDGISNDDCVYAIDVVSDPHGLAQRCDPMNVPSNHGDYSSAKTAFDNVYDGGTGSGFAVRISAPGQSLYAAMLGAQNLGPGSHPSATQGTWFGGVIGLGQNQGGGVVDNHASSHSTTALTVYSGTRYASFEDPIYQTATATSITGALYLYSGWLQASDTNIKERPLRIWAGRHNLRDVSGPGSTIDGTNTYSFAYCYVVAAGECQGGSSVGALYINVPLATTALAGAYVCPWAAYRRNLCVAPTAQETDTVTRVNLTSRTLRGENSTLLSQPFAQWFISNAFVAAVPMPDDSAVWFPVAFANDTRSDMYLVQMPPQPAQDAIVRNQYVNIPINLSGVTGDTVRYAFGYAENGDPATKLYCLTRQENCYTSSTASFASPLVFASETQHKYSCSAAVCQALIPGISGRVVYYRKYTTNGAETIGNLQVAVVP